MHISGRREIYLLNLVEGHAKKLSLSSQNST